MSTRTVERWDKELGRLADTMLRLHDRFSWAPAAVAGIERWNRAYRLLTIDLQPIVAASDTEMAVIIEAVEAEAVTAHAVSVPIERWMAQKNTRQKIAELLTTA
ncbi:hypothetical protein [Pseudoxanthomonas wuyuanensis]|uniref:hypothetical protein n=1 Tax=Pseudoxanthomonas wuyuanensis TaxID=1073196 RepID=UPI000BE2D518|nr:hypothetical protein [Pseudoxanthomonas wuyuanensis]